MSDTVLMGREEVAKLLHMPLSSFDQLRLRGEFPHPLKLGKRKLWPRVAVDEFLQRKFREANPAAVVGG